MDQKFKIKSYSFSFSSYVEKFLSQYDFFNSDLKVLIAVSGGIDSMALLDCFNLLLKKGRISSVRVIHINHGTRSSCIDDEILVSKYCLRHDLELVRVRLDLGIGNSNFEKIARDKRYNSFRKNLKDGEFLLTAHHLDDSFEWSLMQQLKGNSLTAQLGIPLRNIDIIRPFMCVSKKHIERYALEREIEFNYDESNDNLNFERNFIRSSLIPVIKKRYPKYLKHYVLRSNKLALKLNLAYGKRPIEKEAFKYLSFEGGFLIKLPKNIEATNFKDFILGLIKKISSKERGKLEVAVTKMIEARKRGRKGPFQFSGGVHGMYLGKSLVLLNNEGHLRYLRNLSNRNFSQFNKVHLAKLNCLSELVFLSEQLDPKIPFYKVHPLLESGGFDASVNRPDLVVALPYQ